MHSIVHIGAHKTASTHLQIGLRRAGSALTRHGVTVFTPPALRAPELGLQDYLGLPPGDKRLAEHGARLRAAFGGPAERLVISEENILGNAHAHDMIRSRRFYPRAEAVVPQVLDLLPPGPKTVALAMRDPASFLTSAYSQRLMSGAPDRFDHFLEGLSPLEMSWFDLVTRLRVAAPDARIVIWRFEDYPSIAGPVLRALLGPAATEVPLANAAAHPGLSAQAHLAVMAEAPALREMGQQAARARIAALREAHPKGPDAPGFDPFLPSIKARSARAYHEDVGRIATIPGVTLLLRDGVE